MSRSKWSILVLVIITVFSVEFYFISREQAPQKKLYKPEKKVERDTPDSLYNIPVETHLNSTRDTVTLTWQLLANIEYINNVTQQFPEGLMDPVVNDNLKKIKGHNIAISGYVIPLDDETFALSENVMAACFFCGMGGPESVMGIEFRGKTPKLKTDQFVTLIGTFDYNDTNPDDWIYHVKNATLINN